MTPVHGCMQRFATVLKRPNFWKTATDFTRMMSGSSTEGQPITCKAAVAWEPKKPLKIEEIEVAPPEKHEVRVKIVATGVCHTDMLPIIGTDTDTCFPVILGHEAAGIVESVGEDVEDFCPGDHVIPVFIPRCKKCKLCKSCKTNLCEKTRDVPSGLAGGEGMMLDGTSRFKCKDKEILHFMGTSTFSQYTVVNDIHLCKINPKAPLDKVCLLGCGVATGYGAAINTAKVHKGSTCAVFGLGGVGLACVMGCKRAGAAKIYGVDINQDRCKLAKVFGITDFVNPKDVKGPIQEHMKKITKGGLDYTFEAAGSVDVMRQALESCHLGWGVSTIVGVDGSDVEICTHPKFLLLGVTWKGSAYGGFKVDEIPAVVEDYMKKKVKLDEFVTHTVGLEDINDAFEVMAKSCGVRTVVYMHC